MSNNFMTCREAQIARLAQLEQRKKVTKLITEKIREFLNLKYQDGVRWKGSKADLLELLHEVYVRGDIMTPDHRPMTQTYLVETCFHNLGLTVMKNIYSHMRRAEDRKGVRNGNLIERIYLMMQDNRDIDHLLWDSLIERPSND